MTLQPRGLPGSSLPTPVPRLPDGLPDMRVPVVDSDHLAGNPVVLHCAEADMRLRHLQPGSVQARLGANVAVDGRARARGSARALTSWWSCGVPWVAELGVSGDVIDDCPNHIIEIQVRRVCVRNRRLSDQAKALHALADCLNRIGLDTTLTLRPGLPGRRPRHASLVCRVASRAQLSLRSSAAASGANADICGDSCRADPTHG